LIASQAEAINFAKSLGVDLLSAQLQEAEDVPISENDENWKLLKRDGSKELWKKRT
jgi:hypothetical protein